MSKKKNKCIVEIIPKVVSSYTSLLQEIHSLGFDKVDNVEIKKIYSLEGDINKKEAVFITKSLLADPISESFKVYLFFKKIPNVVVVNIWYRPQVLDVEAIYVEKAIKYLGFEKKVEVHSGKQVCFSPQIDKKSVEYIIEKIFMNPLIQYYEVV